MKTLGEDGVEYVEGRPIEIYEGKFVNTFTVEPEDAAGWSDGDEVSFLITARVELPKYTGMKKTGKVKCQKPLRVEEFKALDPDKAKALYDTIEIESTKEEDTVTNYVYSESFKEAELS